MNNWSSPVKTTRQLYYTLIIYLLDILDIILTCFMFATKTVNCIVDVLNYDIYVYPVKTESLFHHLKP